MANYLNKAGVTKLWSKVKELVSNSIKINVTDKLAVADGIATLGADGKLTSAQIPSLKTVNGNSVLGDGDITIDLSLYKIVDSLPTKNIEDNKIYLVVDSNDIDGNLYDEYIYVNSKWEKLGSYRASVELTEYVKFSDVATTEKNGSMSTTDRKIVDGTVNKKFVSAISVKDDLEAEAAKTQMGLKITTSHITASGNVTGSFIETTLPSATDEKAGLMSAIEHTKLTNVAESATSDSPITDEELDAIFTL